MNAAARPRLLIVDDELAQMTALCDTLEDQGYVTTGFTSAKEALAVLRGQEFDLVLTDLMMPEMDGITLLRAALDMDANLVGIVMTGHGSIDTAVEAMKGGALDYILKPFKLSIIVPVLERALAVRRLRLENTELERRVREHTAELAAANQELEAFSYSVSHDLRTPLRHIDGFSKAVLEDYGGQLPPEARRDLQSVRVGAQQMGALIDDLLTFSRLSRQPLDRRTLDTAGLVNRSLEELRPQQQGRQIDLRIGELPPCRGDPSFLKQVWINLLSNALKYSSKQETAIIEVGAVAAPVSGASVAAPPAAGTAASANYEFAYFVRDNGVGFDMRYAHKLFGVFQRLHRAEDYDGTGVGLAIVHRIVHRHGGRVWAEAAVDRGATFYFTLERANT